MVSLIWWIASFAAPGLAGGACDNPDDRARLAAEQARLAGVSKDCAFDCLTDDAACAAACVRAATGLGAACAGCFGAYIDCTTSNCAMRCIFPSSGLCRGCQASHCDGAFERCAGLPIRR